MKKTLILPMALVKPFMDPMTDTADEGDEEPDLEERSDKFFENMLLTFNMDNQDPLDKVFEDNCLNYK